MKINVICTVVQTDREPHSMGPRVSDQFQGNWLGATTRGCIGIANRRGEFTCPTMSELPVDPTAPLVMAVNTGQPVDSQWETSMKLDEESEDIPQIPILWIPQPISSLWVSTSLERSISSLDYQANIFNRVLQDLRDTSHCPPFPPSMAG